MMNLKDFALNMLAQNPNIANNPQAQELVNVIRSGDSTKGEQIAQNMCNTMGVYKEEATGMAKKFFNIP